MSDLAVIPPHGAPSPSPEKPALPPLEQRPLDLDISTSIEFCATFTRGDLDKRRPQELLDGPFKLVVQPIKIEPDGAGLKVMYSFNLASQEKAADATLTPYAAWFARLVRQYGFEVEGYARGGDRREGMEVKVGEKEKRIWRTPAFRYNTTTVNADRFGVVVHLCIKPWLTFRKQVEEILPQLWTTTDFPPFPFPHPREHAHSIRVALPAAPHDIIFVVPMSLQPSAPHQSFLACKADFSAFPFFVHLFDKFAASTAIAMVDAHRSGSGYDDRVDLPELRAIEAAEEEEQVHLHGTDFRLGGLPIIRLHDHTAASFAIFHNYVLETVASGTRPGLIESELTLSYYRFVEYFAPESNLETDILDNLRTRLKANFFKTPLGKLVFDPYVRYLPRYRDVVFEVARQKGKRLSAAEYKSAEEEQKGVQWKEEIWVKLALPPPPPPRLRLAITPSKRGWDEN